ncbi:MAG TPA: M15 family metallopeptidase [Gammaproteobacteria bacterium]
MDAREAVTGLAGKVREALAGIGAAPDLADARGLPMFEDATEFEIAHVSASGREHLLIPDAAAAWREARVAAERDGVTLLVISGFRSFERQLELISAKRARGDTVEEILSVMAPPGCSEHHTGRAVDIGTPGCEPLSENFSDTDAFAWLEQYAGSYGFRMSYPRDNSFGYLYEPWHWCHHAE